jgi:hypothetical protein
MAIIMAIIVAARTVLARLILGTCAPTSVARLVLARLRCPPVLPTPRGTRALLTTSAWPPLP